MSLDEFENEENSLETEGYREPSPYFDARISEIPDGFTGKVRIIGHVVEIDGIMMSIDDGTGLIRGNIGRDIRESLIEEGRTVRAFLRIQNRNTGEEVIWIDLLQDFGEIDLTDYWKIVSWERALKGFPGFKRKETEEKSMEKNPFF